MAVFNVNKGSNKRPKALFNQKIEALREKQRAAHMEWERLSSSGGKAWDDVESGMNTAMGDLAKAYHEAVFHFE